MDKDLVMYNIVNLFKKKGYSDDEIAVAFEDIRKELSNGRRKENVSIING